MTDSFNFCPDLKVTTLLADISTSSPVRGLRPGLGDLSLNWKLPNPESLTSCPSDKRFLISLKSKSTSSFASLLFRPISLFKSSTMSDFVRVIY
ncbi:uncharacterized protein METZ01_LOCUS75160 [marine metagenome]|uniref:Uncharacterized protein n=1 Tax=marine metagenome TaxID=408172 RepID=A0A381U243_9ZZZZ